MEKKIKDQKSKIKDSIKVKKTTASSVVKKIKDVVPTTPKTTKKTDVLHAEVYDLMGNVVETFALPEEMFGVKRNLRLLAQATRIYLANQRAGSASTKTRGEVDGSTRKIYRQKGTGRARHGGIRAPIFVHGGIAHGPKPRDFSLDMPKKMKRAALFAALTEKAKGGAVKILIDLEKMESKTKNMVELLSKVQPEKKKGKTLLVLDEKHENVVRSVRNIAGISYDYARQLHAYEILQHDSVIFMKNALSEMEKTFLSERKTQPKAK